MSRLTLVQGVLLCIFSQPVKAQDSLTVSPVIRHIEITRNDVFPVTDGKPFIYGWANALHIVTQESIIRNDILLKVGQEYDPELAQDSERRLRRLSYLGAASVTATPVTTDSVDVHVTTQDQWSTLVQPVLESGGGRTQLGLTLDEFNLFGFGKRFYTEVLNEPEGTSISFNYVDPQILGSRWTSTAQLKTGPIQDSFQAELLRPFYSPDTKWAMGGVFATSDFISRTFSGGAEVNALRFKNESVQLLLARAFGERFRKKRVQLTYTYQNRNFQALPGRTTSFLPDDELVHSLSGRISLEKLHFAKAKRLDKFIRTEDLTLGSTTSIILKRTGLPIPSGVKRFEFSASRSQAHQLGTKQFAFLNLGYQTQVTRNQVSTISLLYYNKLLPRQTIALHARLDYGSKLEISQQFVLGGNSGLRGYPARQFNGTKRLQVNFEDRIFSDVSILTVALGGVLFWDAGAAWGRTFGANGTTMQKSFALPDVKWAAGFGLRMGYTKLPNSRVGRVDVAFPLSSDGSWGFFIGVDQLFSVN